MMKLIAPRRLAARAAFVLGVVGTALPAAAPTQPVFFTHLTQTSTVGTPLLGGDTLIVDTVVTGETGALTQTVTFTLGADVASVVGFAAWEATGIGDLGPRLVGV